MKKTLTITLAALIAVLLCAPAFAVTNSNHYIEEPDGYPKFNADESEWEVLGWTVVDTEIVRLGYVLDGAGVVWTVDDIDVRDNASNTKPNDCFRDKELDAAIASMGLANGLTDYFAYRIHITLNTLTMEKGDHVLEVAAKYKDGSVGNPFRGTVIDIVKTKEAEAPVDTEDTSAVTDPDETTEPADTDDPADTETCVPADTDEPVEPGDITRGDCNGDGEVNNKDVVTLFRYVSGTDKEEDDSKYDFNNDGTVDNKDVVSLFRTVSLV